MMKKRVNICIIVLCTILLCACATGEKKQEENENIPISYKQNYVEEEITIPDKVSSIVDIYKKDEGNLVMAGMDEGEKNGTVWELKGDDWIELFSFTDLLKEKLPEQFSVTAAVSGNGEICAIIASEAKTSVYFIDSERKITELERLAGTSNIKSMKPDFGVKGELFFTSATQISSIDKESGMIKREFLNENAVVNAYDFIEEGLCVIKNGEFVSLDYDTGEEVKLKNIEQLKNNIKKLNISGNAAIKVVSKNGELTILCYMSTYQSGNPGITAVNKEGSQGLIDGNKTYFGHYDYFLNAFEGENTKCIYSVFSGKSDKLIRYTYNSEKKQVDQYIRIYSLKNNSAIRQKVLLYQQKYPNVEITYEIGMQEDSNVTEQDAIKKLNIEIAAGKGPDMVILDQLRVENYIKQGILSDIGNEISQVKADEELLDNVIDTYKIDGKNYAVPLRFSCMSLEGMEGQKDTAGFGQLTKKVMAMKNSDQILFDPFSFDHITSISYWTYIGSDLTDENGEMKKDIQNVLKKYYELLQKWYSMVDMKEASSKDITDVSLTPYAYREYGNDEMGATQISLDYVVSEWDYQYLIANRKNQYSLLKNAEALYYIPSSILAIIDKSDNKDTAKQFLKFALSKEGQLAEQYFGLKVNKEAIKDNLNEEKLQRYGLSGRKFEEDEKAEIVDNLIALNKSVNTDGVLMGIVLKGAEQVLKKGADPQETAINTTKKIKLYLSE